MRERDTLELQIADARKAIRTAVRLKHSLAADAEINQTLPQLEQEIMDAAVKGEPYMLDLSVVFQSN